MTPIATDPALVIAQSIIIKHDGEIIAQIVNGEIIENKTVQRVPELLEIFWDERLMYRLNQGVVEVNFLKFVLEESLNQEATQPVAP